MTTRLKLFDGRKVTVEQTMTRITVQEDGGEPRDINSREYMGLIMSSTPCEEN